MSVAVWAASPVAVIVAAPTPTAMAFPPLSIVNAFVLLDTHVTVVGVGVAVSV